MDIVFNTFNHEKVLINKLVSDICLPINSQEINLCKENYKHLSNWNFADKNAESKTLEIDVVIGGNYYLDFVCDEVARGNLVRLHFWQN